MSQESFLKAEKAVQSLMETLSTLKEEAVSYKTSTNELDIARTKLVGLIDAIQTVTTDTHQVIKFIRDIGGPEIVRLMNEASKSIESEIQINLQRFKNIKIFCIISLSINAIAMILLAFIVLR